MSFMDDIDKGLQKMEGDEKVKSARENAFIDMTCVNCGNEIRVHKMRAKHGSIQCPCCKVQIVMMRGTPQ